MPPKHGWAFFITFARENLANCRVFLLIRAQFVLRSAYSLLIRDRFLSYFSISIVVNSAQYRGDSGFAGRTYHIVGNLMSRLKCFVLDICRPNEKHGGSVVLFYMKDRWFETHWRHYVVSLSKTLYPMLSTDQPTKTKNYPKMTEKLLTGT